MTYLCNVLTILIFQFYESGVLGMFTPFQYYTHLTRYFQEAQQLEAQPPLKAAPDRDELNLLVTRCKEVQLLLEPPIDEGNRQQAGRFFSMISLVKRRESIVELVVECCKSESDLPWEALSPNSFLVVFCPQLLSFKDT